MATLAPLHSTPARQPFGTLNTSKLRSLQSTKNRQNALPSQHPISLKRRAVSPELSDSENVDPNLFDNLKRKRSALDYDVSSSKASRHSLNVLSAKPHPTLSLSTPQHTKVTMTAPVSAPPAAGRSPVRSRPTLNPLKPQSRKRMLPPSLNKRAPSLSITAALQGTLANKKPTQKRKTPSTTIEDTKPKSWFFDIYEEPESTQDDRMNEWTLSQSATILDISDDESKAKQATDRGKENIDPNEIIGPHTRSMTTHVGGVTKRSRKDAMLDEERKPLGDLNPSEYYAEGLDATSVVLVHDDEASTETEQQVECQAQDAPAAVAAEEQDFTFEAPVSISDISAILASNTVVEVEKASVTINHSEEIYIPADASGDIEIWESESAKDEDEHEKMGMEESVFALQEL